jgi:hypothetical protein
MQEAKQAYSKNKIDDNYFGSGSEYNNLENLDNRYRSNYDNILGQGIYLGIQQTNEGYNAHVFLPYQGIQGTLGDYLSKGGLKELIDVMMSYMKDNQYINNINDFDHGK